MKGSHFARLNRRLGGLVVLSLLAILLMALLLLIPADPFSTGSRPLDSLRAEAAYFPEERYPTLSHEQTDLSVGSGNSSYGAENGSGPALVLVIDDFGNTWGTEAVQGLLGLDVAMTVAVIPGLWASDRIAEAAHRSGKQVIVHLPMAPLDDRGLAGEALLHPAWSGERARTFLDRASRLPHAVGLNNHMGSRATQNRALMDLVARWARRRGWLILDSITHPRSVLYEAAVEEGVPSAQRDVFLDHHRDTTSVRQALHRAARIAYKRSRPVVVIGHPRRATWHVLQHDIPRLREEGMQFYLLSAVTHGDTRMTMIDDE